MHLHFKSPRAFVLKVMSALLDIEVQSIAEIGVYRGNTSILLRELFPKATLYLIDPWAIYPEYLTPEAGPITYLKKKMDRAYQEVMDKFSNDPNTKVIRKMSDDAISDIIEPLDLVFIDGNHSYEYVKRDIQQWAQKCRPGGILSGHDYNPHFFPQIVKVVDELFGDHKFIGPDDTWITQLPKH